MEPRIVGKVEYPSGMVKVYWNPMFVIGWAFSETDDELEISVYLDNERVDIARWGIARYDIWQQYNSESSYESGFLAKFDTKNIQQGIHFMHVIAKSKNFSQKFCQIKIEIGNQEGEPLHPTVNLEAGQPGVFKKLGKKYLEYFKNLTNLEPNYKVLEIGCGMGRFAMPLTKFLNESGEYYGVDIIPEPIEHCKKNISKRYGNFHFSVLNVQNKFYNKKGKYSASEFKFPFPDRFFDFIFLHSVFTHMVFNDVKNYLSEIARILKPGKFCFITYLLVNKKNFSGNIKKQDKRYKFKFNGYYSTDSEIPEKEVYFDEEFIRHLYKQIGFEILEPILYGGMPGSLPVQDIIIAKIPNPHGIKTD